MNVQSSYIYCINGHFFTQAVHCYPSAPCLTALGPHQAPVQTPGWCENHVPGSSHWAPQELDGECPINDHYYWNIPH